MNTVSVRGEEVVYTLEDSWAARQLAYILDKASQPPVPGGRPDIGWLEDAKALFAAADKLDAKEVR